MMKNFIVCGASRAGKTNLSRRLAKEHGVTWLCGDAHVGTIEDAFPKTGVSMHGNPVEVADKMATYFSFLIWNYNYEGNGTVLDTVHLRPDNIMTIREKNGDVPCVFLGYTDIAPEMKLQQIRQNDPANNWWTAERSDEELLEHIKRHQAHSETTKAECEKYNIPYFDTGQDYEKNLELAYQSLVKG